MPREKKALLTGGGRLRCREAPRALSVSKGVRRSWISMSTPSCHAPMSRTTSVGKLHVPAVGGMQHDRHPEDPARGSPQDAEAADLSCGNMRAGPASAQPRGGITSIRGAPRRTGADRPRAADDRAADQGCEVPGKPKSLDSFDFKVIPRLNKMQVLELAPLRMDRPARERHRPRAERHGQDPCRPRARARRLPEGHGGQPSPPPRRWSTS